MTAQIRLATTQQLLWDLITAPEGAASGVETLLREGAVPDTSLAFLVSQHGEMTPVERVDVYANMYFYRLRDCLAEDFPALASHIGTAHFHNLVTDYLLAHPSTHYSLRELGHRLPGFLADHTLIEAFPLAADLATLEWARVEVFDEADAAPIAREVIVRRGMAEPETFRLKGIPALRVLRLSPGVLSMWRAATSENPDGSRSRAGADDGRVVVRVWRKGFSVWHRSIDPDEEECVTRLAGKGATLGELGELLVGQGGGDAAEASAMQRLANLLEAWSADEVVTA